MRDNDSVLLENAYNKVKDKDTSEYVFGISKQPLDTCPMIDEAVKDITEIYKTIRNYERADEDELRDMLSTVEHKLSYLVGYGNQGLLEDIRQNAASIRQWGQEWKDLAKQFAPPYEREENNPKI